MFRARFGFFKLGQHVRKKHHFFVVALFCFGKRRRGGMAEVLVEYKASEPQESGSYD